ncbi:MAG: N-acetyl-gamma-glutamyl-phosphate reductase [Deltaproteobacteria bacterium]|nr:N-acetyl-gamma-glutamyl-phosphate reductase [Deltaproteobacteria bacterium]MBW2019922.1 N-acetyl-gamma-glutamyl-phosphate reductase [Deltaproteobacteria bacterium]MBW2074549.1 N-acetyl-gamma-glutamyl-phosphate reductase [Deltaproteobacteria bacterium]RLB81256.1 MAG: N-acetyl-gamma-glutamyl-phosphate reductase [Deltaproteobacteria bacterium]
MVKVAVIGGTGYAGAELVRILSGHPYAELTMITSRQYAGQPFSDVYPAMAGVVNLTCEAFSEEAVSEAADVIFTALPHKASMNVVPGLIARGKKVVDLSADFRFKDPALYEAWYESHQAKDLVKTAVYGLPEIYFDDIQKASLVGNPGCYPTSVLLPLLPLIKAPFIDCDSIVADSKSGTSGAGRSASLATQFCEVNEGFKAYKVAAHRHNPEMDEVLSLFSGRTIHIAFTPHLVPMTRGMLTTIYVGLKESVSMQDVASYLDSFFANKPFVRICPRGRFPNTMYVKGTNYCDIGFQVTERTKHLVLISAIDNLVKGASGQAVQNMNIMLGLPETAGLDQVPFPL